MHRQVRGDERGELNNFIVETGMPQAFDIKDRPNHHLRGRRISGPGVSPQMAGKRWIDSLLPGAGGVERGLSHSSRSRGKSALKIAQLRENGPVSPRLRRRTSLHLSYLEVIHSALNLSALMYIMLAARFL
jgi:hypothetical protein